MTDLTHVTALALDRIYKAFEKTPGPQQPMSRYPDLVEGPSPAVDLGTAEVDDSNYDGAPWCSGCRARTAAGCKCGPIADNE